MNNDHHQHFLHVRENNDFIGNHFGSFPELHGVMVTNVPPIINTILHWTL